MNIDTSGWGWPQWTVLILLFLQLALTAGQHGKPRLDPNGDPEKYNGFIALTRFAMLLFLLIAGGFYAG